MKIPFLLSLLTVLPSLAQEPNSLSPEEKEEGFVLLFDGKSLDGWRTYKQEKAKEQWKVVDGAITLTAGGGGDLITAGSYSDFDFRWDWKIAENGNSGVMWRVAETDGPPYLTGPEYQLLDSFDKPNHKYAHELPPGNVAGSLYGLVPGKPDWSKPIGQWNESRLVVQGSKFTLYLNGQLTAEVDTASDEWKAMLAKSKFAKWERFAKEATGHLCLQDHGDVVSFRNLRIKPLKAD
ncbi:MAG: DUF1080 domain-containing protein [Akkermansiaceae bacterium]|jgi:hypothetical protein|nr:DUF1080 domain-containing protein [Akkermansiaceae bacterium]